MLIASIRATENTSAIEQIKPALAFPIDAIEMLPGFYVNKNTIKIKELQKICKIPVIFSVRRRVHGGNFDGNEAERLRLIEELAELAPEYIDLEYDTDPHFIAKLHQQYPSIKLICSLYDLQKTPDNLDALLVSMQRPEFSIYKIVTHANSSLDAMRMLNFVYDHSKEIKISGTCLGWFGIPTRVLAPIVNSSLNYVDIEEERQADPSVPAQSISIKALMDNYNYKQLNPATNIYAHLGYPSIHSVGYIFHNQKFRELKQNAVYLKIPLQEQELGAFFKLIRKLPFKGFSITMPLKEKVIPYLDELSEDGNVMQAINTIKIIDGKSMGYNTDGVGALGAIEEITVVNNKHMVLLGAGGTAKAIAYEAKKRGAKVTILNRSKDRAENIAKQLGCDGFGMEKIDELCKSGYDILVNATPLGMSGHPQLSPIPENTILPNIIVLDMVNTTVDTALLAAAREKNCICINGRVVYIKQAIEQEKVWEIIEE